MPKTPNAPSCSKDFKGVQPTTGTWENVQDMKKQNKKRMGEKDIIPVESNPHRSPTHLDCKGGADDVKHRVSEVD